MKKLLCVLGILGIVTGFGGASTAQNAQTEFNKTHRSYFDVPLGKNYTGRSPYFAPRKDEEPPPKPVVVAQRPAPAPAPAPVVSDRMCATSSDGLLQIGKNMPAEVAFGEEFMYEINVRALACAGDIVVTDIVPEGAAYVRSEPPAQVEGNRLTWKFAELDAGQAQNIKVWLKAQREGTLASCATAHAVPRACGSTKVGRALIAIKKTGPETAILGSDITYNIVVSNTGTSVARQVVVTDELPEGLTHPSGKRLSFNVGDLPPGQSKTIPVPVKAAARGKHCNIAKVTTTNAGNAESEACTTVLQPGLKIVKTGTKEQFLNRVAKYDIVVSNTGDTALNGVVVTDTAPAPTTIVAAPGASVAGKTATWNVGSLRAGEEKSFQISLTTGQAGNHCNSAMVATTEGLRGTSEACTLWSGIGAVLLETVDDPDPIIVGDETTYTIRVTNQGTANLNNMKTSAVYDAETQPVSASAGTISGQTVTFPVVKVLPAKQSVTYTVKIKGVKPGDSRNRITISSDEIPKPVVEEESTTVY